MGVINIGLLSEVLLPVPHLVEQHKIIAFVTNETERIDKAISKIEREIELLQEYRIALISEAVTGKIDVREE